MNAKGTCVVTGGNSGIGKAIVRSLAKERYRVVIISRDPNKGRTALEEIQMDTQNKTVELVIGDLGTIEGSRHIVQVLLDRYPDINVLINNAGVWKTKREINVDGLETSFTVNHLAPFVLCNLLFDRLKKNAPSRVVNVNARLYTKGKVNLDETPYGKDFGKLRTYANTKLCNLLFTVEFARRIEGTGVTVNAVHPGVIRTNLGDTSGVVGFILRATKRFFKTPEEGAKAPVWLSTSSELEGVNGKYFNLQKIEEVNEIAKNEELAIRLWRLSEQLSDINYN